MRAPEGWGKISSKKSLQGVDRESGSGIMNFGAGDETRPEEVLKPS
jgi:hypothetical protein